MISLSQWCGWEIWENTALISAHTSPVLLRNALVLLRLNMKDVFWGRRGEGNGFLDRFLL